MDEKYFIGYAGDKNKVFPLPHLKHRQTHRRLDAKAINSAACEVFDAVCSFAKIGQIFNTALINQLQIILA